jgi:hypothetical protein
MYRRKNKIVAEQLRLSQMLEFTKSVVKRRKEWDCDQSVGQQDTAETPSPPPGGELLFATDWSSNQLSPSLSPQIRSIPLGRGNGVKIKRLIRKPGLEYP